MQLSYKEQLEAFLAMGEAIAKDRELGLYSQENGLISPYLAKDPETPEDYALNFYLRMRQAGGVISTEDQLYEGAGQELLDVYLLRKKAQEERE